MGDSVALSALRLQEESCDNRTGPELRFSHNGAMDIGWIRDGLKKPGKTQKGLAVALGVDPAAISRLLVGTRQLKAAEIEKAQIYLSGGSSLPQPKSSPSYSQQEGTTDKIRVLGMAECGADGWALFNGEVVDMVNRPPSLAGAPNGFAVYVVGTSMAPRYEPGEVVYIHPGRPVTPGCYVLVQTVPLEDGAAPRAVIKRLVRRSGAKVTLEQFEPPKTFNINVSEIVSIYKVVGSGDA